MEKQNANQSDARFEGSPLYIIWFWENGQRFNWNDIFVAAAERWSSNDRAPDWFLVSSNSIISVNVSKYFWVWLGVYVVLIHATKLYTYVSNQAVQGEALNQFSSTYITPHTCLVVVVVLRREYFNEITTKSNPVLNKQITIDPVGGACVCSNL